MKTNEEITRNVLRKRDEYNLKMHRIRTAAAAAVPVTALGIAVAGMAIFGGGMSRNELAPAATASESGDIVLTDGSETAVQQEAGSETAVQQETENNIDLEDMTLISSDSAGGYTAEMYFSGITHAPTEEENYYQTDDVVIKLTDPQGRTVIGSANTSENIKENIIDREWPAGSGVPVLGGVRLLPVTNDGKQECALMLVVPHTAFALYSCGDETFESGTLFPYRDAATNLQFVYSYANPDNKPLELVGENMYLGGEDDWFYEIHPAAGTVTSGFVTCHNVNEINEYGYTVGLDLKYVDHYPAYGGEGNPDAYYSAKDGVITVTAPDGRTAKANISECGDLADVFCNPLNCDENRSFDYCLKVVKLERSEGEYVLMLRNASVNHNIDDYNDYETVYTTLFFALNEKSFETGKLEQYKLTINTDTNVDAVAENGSANYQTATYDDLVVKGNTLTSKDKDGYALTFDFEPETCDVKVTINSPVLDNDYPENTNTPYALTDGTTTSDIDKIYEALSDDETVSFDTELDTEIYALADGVVELAGYSYMDGIYAYIRAEDGKYIGYLHCNEILVREGDKVTKGQMIGYAGCTGKAETYEAAYTLKASVQSVIDRTIDSELYSARDIYGKRYIQFNF